MSEVNANTKQYEFKAEVKQLLNILVHSLYTHKEIFVRELISNASDALDKVRFETTKGSQINDSELVHEIKISVDKTNNILRISDSGIGMSSEELVNNIGTIAKSGTSEFIRQMAENKQDTSNMIGKFGVGFYSVFMVANKVVIKTKSAVPGSKSLQWISDGLGSFEITELEEEIKRGTEIEIYLKDEEKEYLEDYRLEQIIKKHSNFIAFPIFLGEKQVNTVKAIWKEPKSSVKPEEYQEFYKFLSHDFEDAAGIIHKSVDAPIQFNCLLFIPKRGDDLFGFNRDNYGLDLYIRRVLIQHKNKDLLPEYMSFVKGVVDSEDLPLNISRETLQEDVIFNKISTSVTSQVLSHLEKMALDEEEKYNEFWFAHSKVFKMGYNDYTNREKIQNLFRFNSSFCKDEKELTSFEKYVHRMKEEQKVIYYVTGPNRSAIESDPHLEIFKAKGIEVIYLFDPVDEFAMNSILRYKDFDLKSVDQADLTTIEKIENVNPEKTNTDKMTEDEEKTFPAFLEKIKEILGEKIKEVRISKRLEESPVCLVNPDDSMSSSMQKILHMVNKDTSVPVKIFEVNQNHMLIRNLLGIYNKNQNDEYVKNVIEQLYESAILMEGYLNDPYKMVNRINKILEQSSELYSSKI